MADEKNLNIDMEEYSIPEEGSAGEYSKQIEPASDGLIKKSSKGKRLLIPLVLIVAILVFYQILSWYSHRAGQKGIKEEQEVARKTQQSMVVQPQKIVEPVAAVTSETSIPTPVVAKNDVYNPDVQNKLDILANRTDANSQQLERLQGSLLRSQAALVALNRTMNDLSSSVQDITKQVQQINASKSKPKQVKKVAKPKPPKDIYHVKAIVPGLAWLESSEGKTISVRVGDTIDGYGVIQLISQQQGMVITSSGSVIQYGVNDF